MNNSAEFFENNNQTPYESQKTKKSKGPIITIIILVIALLGTIGYILYDKGIIFKTNVETHTDEKNNYNTDSNNTNDNNNNNNNQQLENKNDDDSSELNKNQDLFGYFDITKNADSIELIMNGKKHNLSYKKSDNIVVELDNNELFNGPTPFTDFIGEYYLFTASDNKQYLLIQTNCHMGCQYIIANDEGKVIKNLSTNSDDSSISIIDLKPSIFEKYVYFYKINDCVTNTDNQSASCPIIKISINDSKVSEELTGKKAFGTNQLG